MRWEYFKNKLQAEGYNFGFENLFIKCSYVFNVNNKIIPTSKWQKQANENEKTPALTKAECSVFDERPI